MEPMVFKSRKDWLIGFGIVGTNIFILAIITRGILKGEMERDEIWVIPIVLALVLFLFWMYFGTFYRLSTEGLYYQCGPLKGNIKLDRITEVVKNRTMWVGFRPATARKGLIVKFDRFNEIYISPKTNDAFIAKLLELNHAIIISE